MSGREFHSCRIITNPWTESAMAISNVPHGSVEDALTEGRADAESPSAFRDSYTVVERVDGRFVRVPDDVVSYLKGAMLG